MFWEVLNIGRLERDFNTPILTSAANAADIEIRRRTDSFPESYGTELGASASEWFAGCK